MYSQYYLFIFKDTTYTMYTRTIGTIIKHLQAYLVKYFFEAQLIGQNYIQGSKLSEDLSSNLMEERRAVARPLSEGSGLLVTGTG